MKRNFIISLIFCSATVLIFVNGTTNTQSPCDSPLVGGHTGAPGETGCNGCHAGTPNSGTAIIDFDLGTTTYVPGQTYTGFVRLQQTGLDKFGFSALALKNSNNTTIGTFGLLETIRTRTYADGNRNYVSHTPCGADSLNANSWSFTWTAPSVNEDTITLYLGALAANHNHATSGDFSYSRSIILIPQNVNAITETDLQNELTLFPNPASNHLTVSVSNSTPLVEYSIITLSGREIESKTVVANSGQFTADISGLANATYLIRVTAGDKQFTSKFNKQ